MLNVELSVMQVVGSFSTRFGILVYGAEEAYHFQSHASGSYDGVSCKFPMQEHEYCSRTAKMAKWP